MSEIMRINEANKLNKTLINENSYNRNLNTIKLIENYDIAYITMSKLTQEDIEQLLSILVKLGKSQSSIDKVYNAIHQACFMCNIEDLVFKNIEHNTFSSSSNPKDVIAFTLDEEKKLIEYLNTNEDILVDSLKSNIDSKTVKNIIKFALATAMRIGEICSLDKNEHIDLKNKKIIVKTTVTRNIDGKSIIGNSTKTGRKTRGQNKKDVRYIPFGVIFDESEVEKIIAEQQQSATSNLLFATKNGKLIEHSSINTIFKRICRQAGIKLDLPNGCHIHMTKHTGVTRMLECGIDIYVISEIVGTSVEVLTNTYAHILDEFIEKQIEKSKKNRRENNLTLEIAEKNNCRIIPFSKY